MSKSIKTHFLLFFCLSIQWTYASDFLFVSLGSICVPAGLIREAGLRTSAYMPFDWLCSQDGEKLIELLREDFLNFFNQNYLTPHHTDNFLNTYYHLEFVHDQDIANDLREKFFEKYKRRIERFRQLENYEGTVIFLRYASDVNPDFFYQFPECAEITDLYAIRLHKTLSERFPKLNFNLLIINKGFNYILGEERKIMDHVWSIRLSVLKNASNPEGDQGKIRIAFRDYFINENRLLHPKFEF
ncbi:MAG TPA: DUF1796 family putative cysteine peptidase [Chlamydiales bacterium]|nr:DUF1796 family putative cysteine peptidase [Chlamydiales bacterium]